MQNYQQIWNDYFGKLTIPQDLLLLLGFTQQHHDNFYAQSFELYTDTDKTSLKTYSNDPKFLNTFYEFAQANGSGSTYAYWHFDTTEPIDEMPIVAFGDEGGVHIVAKNLRELLQILTYDVEPIINWDKIFYFKNENENDEYADAPSVYHDEFVAWLKNTFDLDPLEDKEQVDDIITNAQAKYGEQFKQWFEQYFKEF